MNYLIIFTIILSIVFIVRNKFDYLFFFFISLLLYHWHIVYGVVYIPPYSHTASRGSQYIIGVIYLAIIFNMLLPKRQIDSIKKLKWLKLDNKFNSIILITISFIFVIASALIAGAYIYESKTVYSEQENIPYSNLLIAFPSAMALIYGIRFNNKLIILFAAIPLLYYVIIGYRAIVVIGIVAIIVNKYKNIKLLGLKMFKLVGLLAGVFLFFAVYKISYIAIKQGEFDYFDKIILTDSRFQTHQDYILWSLFSAEFGVISSNLSTAAELRNTVIAEQYNILNTFIATVPLTTRAFTFDTTVRFAEFIDQYAIHGFGFGLGSSFWGELYLSGGYLLVFIGASAVLIIIRYFDNLSNDMTNKYIHFTYLAAYLAFSIHKTDIISLIGVIKSMFFILCVCYTIRQVVGSPIVK